MVWFFAVVHVFFLCLGILEILGLSLKVFHVGASVIPFCKRGDSFDSFFFPRGVEFSENICISISQLLFSFFSLCLTVQVLAERMLCCLLCLWFCPVFVESVYIYYFGEIYAYPLLCYTNGLYLFSLCCLIMNA